MQASIEMRDLPSLALRALHNATFLWGIHSFWVQYLFTGSSFISLDVSLPSCSFLTPSLYHSYTTWLSLLLQQGLQQENFSYEARREKEVRQQSQHRGWETQCKHPGPEKPIGNVNYELVRDMEKCGSEEVTLWFEVTMVCQRKPTFIQSATPLTSMGCRKLL